MRVPGLSPSSDLHCSFQVMHTVEGYRDGFWAWIPDAHVRDLNLVTASQLQPGLSEAVEGISCEE